MKKADNRKTKRTRAQIRAMERFSNLNREWGKLSYEIKLEWTKSAKEDSVKHSGSGKKIIEGQQLFLSYNGFLQEIGEPINLEPPELKEPQDFKLRNFEIISSKGRNRMAFYFEPAIREDTKVIIYATAALHISKPKIQNKYLRQIAILDSEFKSGGSIMAQYLKVFREFPKKGDVIGIKVLAVNIECGKPGLSYTILYIVR